MNTIVNQLLDVDKEARQMLDEAQQYHSHTMLEIEQEKKKLLETYTEKGRKHIHDLEEEQEGEVDDVVKEVKTTSGALMSAMQKQYDENHRQWEEALFQICTGRREG